jgi:formylglycine-generating enzyme required for sulfatase activity
MPSPLVPVIVLLGACGLWTPPNATKPPPTDTQCAHNPRSGCWVDLPAITVSLGAQSTDPKAPGFDAAATPQEGPHRTEDVPALWMMRGEAPTASWEACVRKGACDPAQVELEGPLATLARADKRTLPLNSVTWLGAQQLCGWMGGRLPTEIEWERAARGPDARRWPWGDTPGCGVRNASLAPQGTREGAPPSARDEMLRGDCLLDGPPTHNNLLGQTPEGMLGLAGSLWEWTSTPGDAPGQRRARGGGWLDAAPEDLRTTVRGSLDEDAKLPDVGVRCVWGQ